MRIEKSATLQKGTTYSLITKLKQFITKQCESLASATLPLYSPPSHMFQQEKHPASNRIQTTECAK